MSEPPTRRLARASAALAVVVVLAVPFGLHAQTADNLSFRGTGAASGVSVTLQSPDFPLFETPLGNSGGPTAQVAVASLGESTGYAAYPDPGKEIVGVPGLVAGLLAEQGLPPTPGYPLYVESDAGTAPERSTGSGPYRLSASSKPGRSHARASGGFESMPNGSTALVVSSAEVAPDDDGGVVATAVSDVQGLTLGPLTFGQVRTVARMRIDALGTITPSTSVEISGMRVGDVPVSIVPDALQVGNAAVPLPVNQAIADVLADSGIQVRILPAEQHATSVTAPAVEVRMPFATPYVPFGGSVAGSATFVLGNATATMTGSAFELDDPGPGTDPGPTPTPDSGALGGTASPGSSLVGGVPTAPSSSSTRSSSVARPQQRGELAELASDLAVLDIRSLYLAIVAGGLASFAAGQLLRRTGVHAWKR